MKSKMIMVIVFIVAIIVGLLVLSLAINYYWTGQVKQLDQNLIQMQASLNQDSGQISSLQKANDDLSKQINDLQAKQETNPYSSFSYDGWNFYNNQTLQFKYPVSVQLKETLNKNCVQLSYNSGGYIGGYLYIFIPAAGLKEADCFAGKTQYDAANETYGKSISEKILINNKVYTANGFDVAAGQDYIPYYFTIELEHGVKIYLEQDTSFETRVLFYKILESLNLNS